MLVALATHSILYVVAYTRISSLSSSLAISPPPIEWKSLDSACLYVVGPFARTGCSGQRAATSATLTSKPSVPLLACMIHETPAGVAAGGQGGTYQASRARFRAASGSTPTPSGCVEAMLLVFPDVPRMAAESSGPAVHQHAGQTSLRLLCE